MKFPRIAKAVLWGGFTGGALDLLFAVSLARYNGAAPSKVFQAITSGLLGQRAYSDGLPIGALGASIHFALSLGWAAILATAAAYRPSLVRWRLRTAIVFGLVVFLTMRFVVLPLSAYPKTVTFKPLATALDLLSHMLLFAGPIVIAIAQATGRQKPHYADVSGVQHRD